jgi:hypothetical protein
MADELVQERSAQTTQDRTYEVDSELTEVFSELSVANQAFHQ